MNKMIRLFNYAFGKAIVVFMLFGVSTIYAQTPMISLQAETNQTKVLEKTIETTRIHFSFDRLNYLEIETPQGNFTEIIMPYGFSTGELGAPKLPASKKLIEIPFGADVNVKVLNYTIEEYNLSELGIKHPLMPVQPSLRKDQDINEVPFLFEANKYTKSGYIEPELASVEVLGVLRGMRIGRLTVAPVNYNPVENSIIVYNNIEVEIQFEGADKDLTNYIKASTYSPHFDVVYSQVINPLGNKDIFENYPDLTKYPIKMVVVSHPDFEVTLQPFIEWKTMQGFEIIEAYTDVIGGTADNIKNYIHGIYNSATPEDPAPTFVVVVGDADKLPASAIGSASGQVTDLYYASVDGDYFPEMYIGRLSARNVQELQNQLDKILYYQRYEFNDPTYLNNATLIAGTDATWNPRIGEPTVKYATANYFNAANGFNTVWGYGVDNDPNNPNNNSGYSGCYDEERISVSMINFTAHCSSTSWGGPTLTVSNVHSMTNTGKYPLAVGNCCQSGLFSHSESIAEAWVRAENKGAVAYVGSAPNTHWFEDFYWSVGAFEIQGTNDGYVPTVGETTLGAYDASFGSDYVAVASKKFVGNLAITEAHQQSYPTHSNVQWYWEGYHTFGDPSTIIYLTEGNENIVEHMDVFPIGMDYFQVKAEPGSYVGISKNGILHGAALIDHTGEVDVPVEPIFEAGDVSIVVTKPQYQPYIAEVPAGSLEGPFVILKSFEINDEEFGNNNSLIDYGETFSLHITLENIGIEDAVDISGTLYVDDQYFTLISLPTVDLGSVSSEEENNTSLIHDAFTIEAADSIPDQYSRTFDFEITDGNDTWLSKIQLTANAPKLSFHNLIIDVNDDGKINPDETADVIITVKNVGHSLTEIIDVKLESKSEWIIINVYEVLDIDTLLPGESEQLVFNITALADTPLEQPVDLTFIATTGKYEFENTEEIIVGMIPEFNMGDSVYVEACIGRFFDSGGPQSNYSNNEDIIMTFYPGKPGYVLEFEFLSFDVEYHDDCLWDWLKIYNGEDTDAELIGTHCGTNSPGTFMALNEKGAITFHFKSDGSVTKPGWEALFKCININEPPPCAENPFPENGETDIVLTPEQMIEWSRVDNAFVYDVYFDKDELPSEVTSTVTQNFMEVDQLTSNTDYFWKVVPYNPKGHAEGCPQWTFSTGDIPDIVYMTDGDISTCNAIFYDSGGPLYEYSNREDHVFTFYPDSEYAQVIVEFLTFDVEPHHSCNYDWLKIYNGENTSADLIGTYCGLNSPGTVIADNESGALTFWFKSDHSITHAGWKANVYCKHLPTYSATFHVSDKNDDEIENAVITFDGNTLQPGNYVIENLLPDTYDFIISKEGYIDVEDSVIVVDENVNLYIVLKEEDDDDDNDSNIVTESKDIINIYPNPTKGLVNIEIKKVEGSVDLILMNYQGQVVASKSLKVEGIGLTHLLDLNNLAKGIYYLRIQSGEFVTINKIVLQ